MPDVEFAYRARRAIVASTPEGLRVTCLLDGSELSHVWTLCPVHAQNLATGWAWHGLPARSQPTLVGIMPLEVAP